MIATTTVKTARYALVIRIDEAPSRTLIRLQDGAQVTVYGREDVQTFDWNLDAEQRPTVDGTLAVLFHIYHP